MRISAAICDSKFHVRVRHQAFYLARTLILDATLAWLFEPLVQGGHDKVAVQIHSGHTIPIWPERLERKHLAIGRVIITLSSNVYWRMHMFCIKLIK